MIKRTIYTLPKDTDPEDGKVIADLIKLHKADIDTFTILESYVDDIPEMQRSAPNELLTIHNYAQYITDVNVGYLLGNPVDYKADDTTSLDVIADNYMSQSISEIDSDLGEDLSMFGQAFENIFTDEDATILSAKLSVYNTIVVYDTTFKHNKMFAVYYAPVLDSNGKVVTDKYDLTIWTNEKILNRTLDKENLVEDAENPDTDHAFKEVPVVHYMNNKRLKGDYEPVITLIDAYNILQSDRVLDREKLVDAILAFYGAKMTQEDMDAIKQNRAMAMPEGSKAEYVIKQIDEADADVLRRTIAADIHKFSKTPDFTDDKFGNNPSGVSLEFKILPFEWNANKKASQFAAGLKDRFRMYASALTTASKMTALDVKDLVITFTRSLPSNDLEASTIINNLVGQVDNETLISQLSFVEDASEVVKKAAKERDNAVRQDNFGTGNFNKDEDDE